jgi:S-DNA-T family DNA segregation ATPase FtsK/SpoIIIE
MQIKRNIPARLSFVLDSGTASTTVLDSTGAEDLPDIPGRGIYKDTKRMTFQAPYITNAQIKKIIEPHIVSKPKKGDQHERPIDKKTEDGKYSLEFKKV